MSIFSKITYGFLILALLLGAFIFLMPTLPLIGTLEMKIVKSGSMEPAIKTGSVVVIREGGPYAIGDVITFESRGAAIPTTHRIIGTEMQDGESRFVSKGDANEEQDTELVSTSAILGKVLFSIPYLGFIIDFARQPIGFALLIGLPAFLIILDEIEKIWRAMKKRREEQDHDSTPEQPDASIAPLVIPSLEEYPDSVTRGTRKSAVNREAACLHIYAYERHARRMSGLTRSALTVCILGSCAFVSTFFIEGTFSYAKDIEAALGNLFRANAVDFVVTPPAQALTIVGGVLEDDDDALIFDIAKHAESTDLMFTVTTEVQSGDPLLCDALLVDSDAPDLDPVALTALSATEVDLPASWTLALAVDGSVIYPSTSECVIDFVFTAWDASQEDGPYAYSDEERITFTITALPEIPLEFRSTLSELSAFLAGGEVLDETGTTTEPETSEDGGGGSSEEEVPVIEEEAGEGETEEESTVTDEEMETETEGVVEEVIDGEVPPVEEITTEETPEEEMEEVVKEEETTTEAESATEEAPTE